MEQDVLFDETLPRKTRKSILNLVVAKVNSEVACAILKKENEADLLIYESNAALAALKIEYMETFAAMQKVNTVLHTALLKYAPLDPRAVIGQLHQLPQLIHSSST
jgi:hypothetical protein